MAVITGASQGIGAATAKLVAENGAKVVVNRETAQQVVEAIHGIRN
ncbi:SDR family NAD(P)-dependent oxidoreductase [Priestia filamentosa]